MIVTPNMGLKVWNLLSDVFSHAILSGNWTAIDGHDHTAGNGAPIPTGGIADGAITTTKLATAAVTRGKIANGAVDWSKIDNGSITYSKLDPGLLASAGLLASRGPNSQVGQGYYATDIAQWFLATGSAWTALGLTVTPPVDLTPSDYTVSSGQIVNVTAGSSSTHVVHLPTPQLGAIAGVVVNDTSVNSPVGFGVGIAQVALHATGGALIYGEGLTGAAYLNLGTLGSHAVVINDSVNWFVISGIADSGWIPLGNIGPGENAQNWGVAGYHPAARQVGSRLYLRGALVANTTISVGGAGWAQMPAGKNPVQQVAVAGQILRATSGTLSGSGGYVYNDGSLQNMYPTIANDTWFLDGAHFALA